MEVKTLSSFVERIDTDEDTMEDFRESDSESIWELILAAEPGADGYNFFFCSLSETKPSWQSWSLQLFSLRSPDHTKYICLDTKLGLF